MLKFTVQNRRQQVRDGESEEGQKGGEKDGQMEGGEGGRNKNMDRMTEEISSKVEDRCKYFTIIDVCIGIFVMMSSDLYGTCGPART